ncbi:MAG: putative metal-binding motif-containing protein [Myxococcaceae bacterium]
MNLRQLVVAFLLAGAASCSEAPQLLGPYRCNDDLGCGDTGFVCDDGVCCNPTGEPLCRSYVLDGGTCANGNTPTPYYADFDRDGFGNENEVHYYCAPPIEDHFIAQGGDCNDTPSPSGQDVHPGALTHPGAHEQCDFQDNDCDGEIDEGLDGTAYYPDLDGDGHGAVGSEPVSFCAAPANMARDNRDCNDGDKLQSPDAIEVCNARDDDCDGAVDEDTEAGANCEVPEKMGVCARGKLRCSGGSPVCVQTVFPSLDACDGLDNNCNGQADEKPDCAGPATLTSGDVTFGAKRLSGPTLGGITSACLKDKPGTTNDISFDGSVWSGTGAASHIAWVERTSGYWDLSHPDARMKLKLSWTVTNGNNPAWAGNSQPVILFCGPRGYVRRVYDPSKPYLMVQGTGSLDQWIPTNKETDWVIPVGTNLDVLKQVERIELLIQPEYNSGVLPRFDINVQTWGFP